jgi:hypothetical protein
MVYMSKHCHYWCSLVRIIWQLYKGERVISRCIEAVRNPDNIIKRTLESEVIRNAPCVLEGQNNRSGGLECVSSASGALKVVHMIVLGTRMLCHPLYVDLQLLRKFSRADEIWYANDPSCKFTHLFSP